MSNLIILDNYRKRKFLLKKPPTKKYKKRVISNKSSTPLTDEYSKYFSDIEKELLNKFNKEDNK